jgi:hypothetical protein|uniref:Uncharacterized protein n=1 Tax=viral metagenome TaxID=1070528 RepID=A0A6C0M264_9ZZZZ
MSTLPPNKKVVNGTLINNDETLCTFSFVYNSDPNKQGMFAYPQEGDSTPIKIQNMVIKSKGNYEYYNNDGVHDITKQQFVTKIKYLTQATKYTDGVLTKEEERMLPKGGYKRKSKSQQRKKSRSQRRRKSIKRRH